jgi:uncharacterized protein (TIGR02594 family)
MTTLSDPIRNAPAPIRHKNPGAMGLGSSAKRFGATKNTRLNDGAGNVIATFPTSVDGAGALFHLLYTHYAGKTLWDALHIWGDGATLEKRGETERAIERTNGYAATVYREAGIMRDDVLTKDRLTDPFFAILLGKAMARHEAGVEYPMTDAQWQEAHGEFLTVIQGGNILLDRNQPTINLKPLELARARIGEHELPGDEHNDFIVSCFRDVGSSVRKDEIAWCAAFTGAMLKRAGCAYLVGVLEARKYLNYGHALDEPEEGCVVVFWRVNPNGWQGHVAIVESFTATHLTIIGGNQGDAVTRMTVPRTGPQSQVLGYRRPVPNTTAAKEIVKDDSVKRKVVGILSTVVTILTLVWNALLNFLTNIGEFIGVLPDTAASATAAVSAGQQAAQAAGVPWPAVLGLVIVLSSLSFGLYGTWKRLRPNKGTLTKAPYETDEAPAEGAVDSFDVVTLPKDITPIASGDGYAKPAAVLPARARAPKNKRATKAKSKAKVKAKTSKKRAA